MYTMSQSIKKATLVFGASPNPDRFSFKAVQRLVAAGHPVFPLGLRKGTIGQLDIIQGTPELLGVDTITLYVRAELQRAYYDYFFSLKPKRIIFNPGTENYELMRLARSKNIEVEAACTLVMLSLGDY